MKAKILRAFGNVAITKLTCSGCPTHILPGMVYGEALYTNGQFYQFCGVCSLRRHIAEQKNGKLEFLAFTRLDKD